jgi:hypothetical protein
MIYACPAWELVAYSCLLKLQRLQNKVLCTTGNFPRCTLVGNLHTAFNLLYIHVYDEYEYEYITKLCRQQAEVIKNHENEHVRSTGQGEARHTKCKRFKLGSSEVYGHFTFTFTFALHCIP